MLELFAKWCAAQRKFRANQGGNILVTFALTLVPVMSCVGAAVDYSHANSIKVAMQAALDATAIAMSKTAASMTADALQLKSTDYFKAIFSRPEATSVTVKTTLTTTGGSSLIVAATADMKTNFMGMMGFPTLHISGSSTAAWGNSRVRVALALDNTGSMAQFNKLTALKS